jgi:hypothetical protein
VSELHRRLEAPQRAPERFSPIFVLATARSYSSVVTTMIGQHPGLAALPELKLFAYETIGELEASLPRFWRERGVRHRSPGLVRAVAQLEFGDQNPDSLISAQTWLTERSDWAGAHILDVLMARIGDRAAVEKSPENVDTDEGLRRLASAYPRARYLHLTRHPVTTQRSIEEHWSRIFPNYSPRGGPMRPIAAWVETQCRIVNFSATLPNSRYLRIRAEDVLNDRVSQLRRIAEWLEIRTGDDAIEAMMHPEASPFACPGPAGSGIEGGNDPDFLRNPIPRRVEVPRTLDAPHGWVGNAALWRRTVEIATRLGYP